MSKISLTDLVNLQNETTAVGAINANNAALITAFDNTLSRDGTSPNTMSASLDMNSNQILNLPAPSTVNSPARLIDVTSNPTIVVPGTGTSGHAVPFLDGNNTWSGTNAFSGAGTYTAANSFSVLSTFTAAIRYGGVTLSNSVTGTGSMVLSTSPTLVTPVLGTPTSVTLTNATGLPVSTGISGLGTGVATLLATPSSANLLSALTDKTGTGVNVFATTPTLVTPVLGVATGTSLAVTGLITSSSATTGMGYATGAGGTVTQATNKSTGVTLNKVCGQIVMNGAALAANTPVTFVLTNSSILADDVIVTNAVSGMATGGSYLTYVSKLAAGSCSVTLYNFTVGSLSEAVVIQFAIVRGVHA